MYDLFPELSRRVHISGTLLSGGEQQMLAVGRALVTNPRLLMMDEPSEGLSTQVIGRVEEVCRHLSEGGMAILLVEQNLEMAQFLAQRAYVLLNGQISHELPAAKLAADQYLLRQLLGVSSEGARQGAERPEVSEAPDREQAVEALDTEAIPEAVVGASAPTLWSGAAPVSEKHAPVGDKAVLLPGAGRSTVLQVPVADIIDKAAYIVGTFDTKARDLLYIKSCLDRQRLRTITVDLSTSRKPSPHPSAPPRWRAIIQTALGPFLQATVERRWPAWPGPSPVSLQDGVMWVVSFRPAEAAAPHLSPRRCRVCRWACPR